jgi:hypothetical protein
MISSGRVFLMNTISDERQVVDKLKLELALKGFRSP